MRRYVTMILSFIFIFALLPTDAVFGADSELTEIAGAELQESQPDEFEVLEIQPDLTSDEEESPELTVQDEADMYTASDDEGESAVEEDGLDADTIDDQKTVDFTVDHVQYHIINETEHLVSAIGYEVPEEEGKLDIPAEVTDKTIKYKVTEIGDDAFHFKTGFKELKLGKNLTRIGSYAFWGCNFENDLEIPSSVQTIGESAFSYYFYTSGCSNFRNGQLKFADNSKLKEIGKRAFYGCPFTGDLNLPDSVETVGEEAFASRDNDPNFTGKLTLGSGIKTIGRDAFSGCGFTGNLEFADGIQLTQIVDGLFAGLGFTGELRIPPSMTSIGKSAFEGCHGFNGGLILPSSGKLQTIGNRAFKGCNFTGGFAIPDNVVTIGDSAFATDSEGGNYYSNFTSTFTLGNSVKTIGSSAFYGCRFTDSLMIPDSVETIGSNAFASKRYDDAHDYHNFEKNLKLGRGVKSIGAGAFSGCGFTGTLAFANGLKSIDSSAFSGLGFTGELSVPGSVKTIGSNAFKDCTGLTSLTLNNGVTTIGNNAFKDCTGLTNLTLNDDLTTIGDYAFSGCGFSRDLNIPDSVTSIGDYAFSDSYKRKKNEGYGYLKIGNKVQSIGKGAFKGCSAFKPGMTIGESVTTIGDDAFNGVRFDMVENKSDTAAKVEVDTTDFKYGYVPEGEGGIIARPDEDGICSIGNGKYRFCFMPDVISDITSTGTADVKDVCNAEGYEYRKFYTFTAPSSGLYCISCSCPYYKEDYDDINIPLVTVYDEIGQELGHNTDHKTGSLHYLFGLKSGIKYFIEAYCADTKYRFNPISYDMAIGPDGGWGTISDCMENAAEYDEENDNVITITAANPEVWYEYNAPKDDVYFIYSEGNDAQSNARAHLYDSRGMELASADNGEENNNFLMSCTLKAGDTYYIRCESNNTSDNYKLHVQSRFDYLKQKSGDLTENGYITLVPKSGQIKCCKITPQRTGLYIFYSKGFDGLDVRVETALYDPTGKIISDTVSDGDFILSGELGNYRTYYLTFVYNYSDEENAQDPKSLDIYAYDREEVIDNESLEKLTTATEKTVDYTGDPKYYSYLPEDGKDGTYILYTSSDNEGGSSPRISMLADDRVSAVCTGQSDGSDYDRVLSVDLKSTESGAKYPYFFKAESSKSTDKYKIAIAPKAEYMGIAAANYPVTLDTPAKASVRRGGWRYFKYVPESNGDFVVSVTGGVGLHAGLYDEDGKSLYETEQAGGELAVSGSMQEGKTYYLEVGYPDGDENLPATANLTVSVSGFKEYTDPIKENETELEKLTPVTVEYKGSAQYFKYTATTSGEHVVYVSGGKHPYVTMLKEDLVSGTGDCGYGNGDDNIQLFVVFLEAKKTYHFKASSPEGEDSFTLAIAPKLDYIKETASELSLSGFETIPPNRSDSYFYLMPMISGEYDFYSEAENKADDPAMELLSNEGERIGFSDDHGRTNDFRLTKELFAGHRYFVHVYWNDFPASSGCNIFARPVNTIDISSATITLSGDTYTYTGNPYTPAVTVKLNGKMLINGTDYTVRYSNNVNPGTATVTVKGIGNYSGSKSVTFTIKAKPEEKVDPDKPVPDPTDPDPKPTNVDVTGISLDKTSAKIKSGKNTTLTAIVTPDNATDKSVKWSTSNSKVATVSSTGEATAKVTAKSAGTAIITATASNGLTATCTVKVPGMTINGNKLVLKKGTSSSAIKVTFVNDSLKSATTNKKSVATVKTGKKNKITITGKKKGSAVITIKSKAGLSKTVKVTVQKKKVTTTKLKVSKTKVTLSKKGKKAVVTATATPDEISTGEQISVSTSNKNIATAKIDATTGKITITAKKKGNCTITVKAGKISQKIEVTVKK